MMDSGKTKQIELRPASRCESDLFYALPEERDRELGCIGHVRIDFGHRGREFWHTWWPRGEDALNTQAFKDELGALVDQLRADGPLKSLDDMADYCYARGGWIDGGWCQNYGFVAETENYRFCLRCIPAHGDYNAYLTAYDLCAQQINMSESPRQGPQMGGMV